MARHVTLPDCPPSIVFRRSDGKLLSPEWEGEYLRVRMERLVQIIGPQIIEAAMEAAREAES